MAKMFLQFLLFLLPWGLRRRALNALFGYRIARGAKIGFSFVVVKRCVMAEGARIGHLSVVRGLNLLRLDEHAILNNLNWVTGFPPGSDRHFLLETDRDSSLIVEAHAAITNRHMIDCTDRVTIRAFATIGGFRSQILTHSIDFRTGRQSCLPVTVGAYSFTGTGAILLKGSALPDRSILSAGSVLIKAMTEPGMLYSGNPAKAIRPIEAEAGYFVRDVGYVD